jgi:hypothetical protein
LKNFFLLNIFENKALNSIQDINEIIIKDIINI